MKKKIITLDEFYNREREISSIEGCYFTTVNEPVYTLKVDAPSAVITVE